MAITARKLTAEEFFSANFAHAELVDGEVVEYMPTGGIHGKIAAKISRLLGNWAADSAAGEVGLESGFIVQRNPDRVRAPDVWFISAARLPEQGTPEGFWDIAPDLVVEIISPSDTHEVVRAKLSDYRAMKVPLVWLVYPRSKEVEVFSIEGLQQLFHEGDDLEFPQVLPGFSCKVGQIV